jgi:twitching motility two-component system response regulator PilG
MNQYSFARQKFDQLLKQLQQEQVSGILYINHQIDSSDRQKNELLKGKFSSILVWKNGGIVYADSYLPNSEEIAKNILEKYNPKTAEIALKFATKKINTSSSVSPRDYLLYLTKIAALRWETIEAYIQTQTAIAIENLSLNSGTAYLDKDADQKFALSFGKDEHALSWTALNQELEDRRRQWKHFEPRIPALDSIPHAPLNQISTIPNVSVRQHIQRYVNGQRSLMEIAKELKKDPLTIARSYYTWVESGWINFKQNYPSNLQSNKLDLPNVNANHSPEVKNLPTILSVDDSPIVQATIKRALQDNYNVLLSNNAVDALKILNSNKIDLLLLDVTMPDIDGLEMCKTLRNIPKLKNIPIVMVTARDTLIDKMKGQIAGTNHYLTKPFDNEKLRAVIDKYIDTNNKVTV